VRELHTPQVRDDVQRDVLPVALQRRSFQAVVCTSRQPQFGCLRDGDAPRFWRVRAAPDIDTNSGKSSSKWLPFVWPLDQWPSSECHGGKLYR
jgi:hypothetical protein